MDDLGIDPWSDYNNLPSVLPTASPVPSLEPEEWERDDIYTLDSDTDSIPFALPSGDYNFSVSASSRIFSYWVGDRDTVNINGVTSYTFSRGRNPLMLSPGHSPNGYLMHSYKVANAYYQIESPVSFSASGTDKIYLNGAIACYPMIQYETTSSVKSVFFGEGTFRSQLLINGQPYGSKVDGSRITLNKFTIDLSKTGNIYSIGLRVFVLAADTYSDVRDVTDATFNFYVSDTISVVSDESGGDNGETVGLLGSIIEFLKSIVNGITNVAQQIAHLPGLIADEIMGRLRSLFVPTAEDIELVKGKYITLLEERLGFLWQAMTFITDTANRFLAALEGSSDYVFNLPALTITLPSGEVTIVQAQTISFDNTLFTTVRTAAGTMFSFVIVLGFLNVSEKMVVAIVSGKSYFDYLKGGAEE